MSRDLSNLKIKDSYQYLLQVSGSEVEDGIGNAITTLNVTASEATHALTADSATTATTATTAATASFLLGNGESVGHLDFADSAETTTERRLNWNDTDGTLNVGLKGGNVTLQVGQEEVARVVNGTGADLLEAQYRVVKVIGAQGQRLQVGLALADSDINSATTLGLVTETIANNQEGFITLSGLVRGINTTGALQGETWNDGDVLYLSGTTPGGITNVKPLTPTHLVTVGYVVYAHQNNGKIFVKIDNGYELEELHDVLITTPADGEALVYDAGIWKNGTPATASYALNGGVTSIIAGTNITIDQSQGDVTINSTGGGGDPFPYTGSAQILGSLDINTNGGGSTVLNLNSNGSGSISTFLNNFGGASQPTMYFSGDNAYFQADGNFFIENAPGGVGTGNISVVSNGNISFTSNASNISFNSSTNIISNKAVTQQFTAPASFGESNFSEVSGTNVGTKAYGVNVFGVHDYSAYGVKYEDAYIMQQWDSFGFNYGTEFTLNGKTATVTTTASGSGQTAGWATEDDFAGNANLSLFGTNINATGPLSVTGLVSSTVGFSGDGSALTNLPVQDPFPYSGQATVNGNITNNTSAPTSNFTYKDQITVTGVTGADINRFTVYNTGGDGFGDSYEGAYVFEQFNSAYTDGADMTIGIKGWTSTLGIGGAFKTVTHKNVGGSGKFVADTDEIELNTTGNVSVGTQLVLADWANLDFADDAAAAAGGVPLGGIYRSGNVLLIRIV